MGVIIETEVWEPHQAVQLFICASCFLSIFCLPYFTNRTPSPFDRSLSFSSLRFQKSFLLLYSISSVMEGLWSVFGEYEFTHYGASGEEMVMSLCIGYAAALFFGTFLGFLSDFIGQKKICLLFYTLHLVIAIWKRITSHPSLWSASICLSIATSIFSFSFETWMVVENNKLGHRQDGLNDMFWLMIFFESACYIGSQVLANWMVGSNGATPLVSPSTAIMLLAIIGIIFVIEGWKEVPRALSSWEYRTSFCRYVVQDKRVWLLVWAQACLQFSIAVFWLLWAPTIVADGREVVLGLIYPCLMGARMLGGTAFPWFFSGPLSLRTEDCLVYLFAAMGLVLSIVAYDYEEIGVLVMLFSLFHACCGLVLPSLARLRSIYVPNELRGGVISLSLALADAAILFYLLQGGYYRNIGNSTMFASAALCLFSAGGCMHLLNRWGGKQPHQNWRKL